MKYISTLIITVIILTHIPCNTHAYSAKAMILTELTTGVPLCEKNADVRLPMASTTKIMTALVTLENISLDTVVSVPSKAVGIEGSSMYLKKGEKLTVGELLYGLMLTSGNDAAVALAIAVSGDEASFVSLMNERAKTLGLIDTHFTNPSGLPDADHYTTARELSVITAAALKNPTFAKIVKSKRVKISGRTLTNHNKLLSLYDGAIGVKTGFTKKAGRCLVGAATRDGVTLICVTLNDGDDWNDHMTAFDYGFEHTERVTLCDADAVAASLSTPDGKTVYANYRETLTAVKTDVTEVKCVMYAERFVYAPKTRGTTVGECVFFADGKEVGRVELYLAKTLETPPVRKELFITKLINTIKGFFKWQN